MILGPEFSRNVWLRFSKFNVFFVPVLYAAILFMLYIGQTLDTQNIPSIVPIEGSSYMRLIYNAYGNYFPQTHWLANAQFIFFSIAFLILFVWGGLDSSSSFTSELRNKTWDMQKISAIHPMHMVIGKLLGSAAYAWYAGLVALAVVAVSLSYAQVIEGSYSLGPTFIGPPHLIIRPLAYSDIIWFCFVVILSAFIGHIVSAYCSLNNLTLKRKEGILPFIAGIFVSIQVFSTLDNAIIPWKDGGRVTDNLMMTKWYGFSFQTPTFLLYSILFFSSCCAFALYRFVRKELSYSSYPFFRILFLFLLSGYLAGFLNSGLVKMSSDLPMALSFAIICVFSLTCYFEFYRASLQTMAYSSTYFALKQKNFRRVFENMPVWIFFLGIIIMAELVFSFTVRFQAADMNLEFKSFFRDTNQFDMAPYSLAFLITLFMIRDGLAMHFCLWGQRFKSGHLMLFGYYAFAYFILPYVFGILLIQQDIFGSKMVQNWQIFSIFYPIVSNDIFIMFTPIIVENLLLGLLLNRAIRKFNQKQTT